MAPRITGRRVVTLTVRDQRLSATWYAKLFGAHEYSYVDDNGVLAQVSLSEPESGLLLCLVSHPNGPAGPFDEARCGLDHSGVKEPSYTANAMLTFRDPDNIQLEFFWSAHRRFPSSPQEDRAHDSCDEKNGRRTGGSRAQAVHEGSACETGAVGTGRTRTARTASPRGGAGHLQGLPHLQALISDPLPDGNRNWFEDGLDVILDGVQARRPSQSGRPHA